MTAAMLLEASNAAALECPICLLPSCRGRGAHVAGAAVCVCDRPMPLGDGLCLKCGRPVPGADHG